MPQPFGDRVITLLRRIAARIAGQGIAVAVLVLAGCTSSYAPRGLPTGAAAYPAIAPDPVGQGGADYRIGPLDTIGVIVFGEPDLTQREVQVDASGNVSLPLIGTVPAAGRTAGEFARGLEQRLGARYLVRPQVTVSVVNSVSQKVTVQGEVNEPGVFEIKGNATLLEAVSRAKGETRVAALKQVVIFRTISGQRTGAVFDLAAIRRGEALDPPVKGNDVVIVGYAPLRGAWRDFLQAAPVIGFFRPF